LPFIGGASAAPGSSFTLGVLLLPAPASAARPVTVTSSDPAATLPAPYAYTTKDVGQHTFTGIVLRTAGTQTITATDSNGFSVTSGPIAVSSSS